MRINLTVDKLFLADASKTAAQFRADFLRAYSLYQAKPHLTRLNFNVSLVTPAIEEQLRRAANSIQRLAQLRGADRPFVINTETFKLFVSRTDCLKFEDLDTLLSVYLIDAALNQTAPDVLEHNGSLILHVLFDVVKIPSLLMDAPGSVAAAGAAAVSAEAEARDETALVAFGSARSQLGLSSFPDFVLAQWAMTFKAVFAANHDYLAREHHFAMQKYKLFVGNLCAPLLERFLEAVHPSFTQRHREGINGSLANNFQFHSGLDFIQIAKRAPVGFSFNDEILSLTIAEHFARTTDTSELLRSMLMVMLTQWANSDIFIGERDFEEHFEKIKLFVNQLIVSRYDRTIPWLKPIRDTLHRFELFNDPSVIPTLEEAQEIVTGLCKERGGLSFTEGDTDNRQNLRQFLTSESAAALGLNLTLGADAIADVMNQNIQRAGLIYSAKLYQLLQTVGSKPSSSLTLAGAGGTRSDEENPQLEEIIAILSTASGRTVHEVRAGLLEQLSTLRAEAIRNGGVATRTIDIQLRPPAASSALVPARTGFIGSVVSFFRSNRGAQAGVSLAATPMGFRLQLGVDVRTAATGAAALEGTEPSATALVSRKQ